jgi:hypothetical protein
MGYAELLKDPRWQKKRLEIMERDKWTCQVCLDKESTLTVHHKSYKQDECGEFLDPWEYDDSDLTTLCDECHKKEEFNLGVHKKNLFFAIREHCEDSDTIRLVGKAIKRTSIRCNRRLDTLDLDKVIHFMEHNLSERVDRENVLSMPEMLEKLMGHKDED